jgi:hypothetical protein
MSQAAISLRTAERFLLAPPLAATYGSVAVDVCDVSAKGARFRHTQVIEAGSKAILLFNVGPDASPLRIEAVVIWSQSDPSWPGRYMTGVRTYAVEEQMETLIASLHRRGRVSRIEELRSTDRFYVLPTLDATFDGMPASIEDLSARGARVELPLDPPHGAKGLLQFTVPQSSISVAVTAQVAWTSLKAITGRSERTFRTGLFVNEKPELMRLAIGRLCELNRAALDTQSLRLKLKIIRARARQMAPSFRQIEASGIPAEQYLLIQGVREELRLNPDEAMHWYRRARLAIADPATRSAAPPIADHPDALAVWEYLDRSVDPSIVSRAFSLA